MIRNYFITAFRNFGKNKIYTLLNIFGLGIGMASCLFVFTIINFENSFDNWHSKKDRIYRAVRHYYGDNRIFKSGIIPYTTGDALKASIPDIEGMVQFHGPVVEKIKVEDENSNISVFREDQILYTDEQFFEVLDFQLIKGSADQIKEPFKVFITPSKAKKYYGNQDPIGKILINDDNEKLEIAGIIQESPDNTNLPYDMIISMATFRNRQPDLFTKLWGTTWAYSLYLLLPEDVSRQDIELKMTEIVSNHVEDSDKDKVQMLLQPLSEIHTDEQYGDGTNYVTPSMIMYAFTLIGFLLLATACLNFVNLSTAQAVKRSKEVGIRKTLGSHKHQLVIQFLLETLMIVIVSTILAFTMGQIMIQQLNNFLTIIEYDLSYAPESMLFALLMIIVVTLLAGSYPSLIISRYQPIAALHNQINLKKGSGNINLRRILVVAQFVFTNLMLISMLIIASQMDFIKSKDLGFETDNIAIIELPSAKLEKYETLKNTFLNKSYVEEATLEYGPPQSSSNWNNSYKHIGKAYEDGNNANIKFIDKDYLSFYGIDLIAGQNVKTEIVNDSIDHVLVNMKLAQSLGWDTPEAAIGQWFENSNKSKIIGVVEDFNVWSLKYQKAPVILMYQPQNFDDLAIKLPSQDIEAYLPDIKSTFHEHFPGELFEFAMLKNDIQENYIIDDLLHSVIQFVSVLAIVLSSMGLYGLVSFMTNQNAKNIGIRKVFGASTYSLLSIFGKEYAKLLVIAFLLAVFPVWFLMHLWIEEFTYRINITYIYFLSGFLISLVITVLTVGYKSYQSAVANPVESLRHE